jgi:predicted AAA+ superfamily ATPase
MERSISKKLKKWKDRPDRKPLVLEGARQVGKTYLLQKFGKENYKNTIYLNLENASSDIVSLFDGDLNPVRIITSLEIYFGEKIIPGETLIIFDEVQEVPRALTSLKYFCEKAPQFHIVVAGSLLGLYLHSGTSFPVGKVDFLHLEPMNFEEFLVASGESELLEQIKSSREILFPDKLQDYFRYYLVTGGMPEVVSSWIDEHNIEKVEKIQDNILSSYMRDFSQHCDTKTAMKIRQVWDTLTSQFAKENSKFIWGLIKKGARAREYETAIQWLVDGGLVRRVDRVKVGDKLL